MKQLLGMAAGAAVAAAMPASAWTTIDLFPNIGPPSITSHGVYEPGFAPTMSLFDYGTNAVGAMLDGQASRGGNIASTPAAFNTLPDANIRWSDIISTEFNSWRGNVAPSGAFAAEKGSVWRVGVRIESSTPFTIDHLVTDLDYPYATTSLTLADLLLNSYPEGGFAPWLAVGIYYGADGIRGTADDVVCDSLACDPLKQPLNLLAWRGRGISDQWTIQDLNDYYGGDKDALIADEKLWFAGAYGGYDWPFRIYQKFTLTDANGDLLVSGDFLGTVTVPEPASWATMIAGFGLIGAALRRRRVAAA